MKVGDYVRTDDGCICKVLEYTEISNTDFYVNTDSKYNVVYKSWIVKSSPNIIDLIEIGDILMIKDMFGNVSKVEVDEDFKLLSGTIISIVTKEQFESMEYKVC